MRGSCWCLVAALFGISLLAGCAQQEAPVAAAPQSAAMVAAPATAAAPQDQDHDWGPSTVPGHYEPTPGQ